MARRATTAIEGHVVSTAVQQTSDGNVRTAVTLVVDDSLKGSTNATQTVFVPGGKLADGMTMVVDSMASFSVGDTAYVFADERGWVMGGVQGKIGIVDGCVEGTGVSAQTVSDRISEALGKTTPSSHSLATVGTAVHEVVLSGPKTRNPSAATTSIENSTVWLNDGFESGSVYTNWNVIDANTWGAVTGLASTGSYSAWCIGNNAYSSYPDSYYARMINGPVNLSSSGGSTKLTADLWLQSEAGFDYAKILVSVDGVNYYGTAYSGVVNAWSTKTLDLSNIYMLGDVSRSPQLWVMLAFQSDTSISAGYGALFDNVSLSAAATGPTPIVSGISPSTGSAGTNTHVTISGSDFGATQGDVEFSYGRESVMRMSTNHIASWSNTEINCEVPTGIINNYFASAGSGPVYVTTATGAGSNAYAFTVPFGYGAAHWALSGVSYRTNTSGINAVQRENLVDAAVGAWNAAGSSFRFTDGGLTTAGYASDGVCVISWADGLPSGVIAQTSSWWSDDHMTEADIVMSNEYSWGDGSASTIDIQSIAVHETGHWLRLLDQYNSGDSSKVMYGYGSTGTVKRALATGDVEGIKWIYPPSVGTVTAAIDSVLPNPVTFGSSVTFVGHGGDSLGHTPFSYEWRRDAPSGTLLSTSSSFSSSSLPVGTYSIYFKVRCANGTDSAWVSSPLTINAAYIPPGTLRKVYRFRNLINGYYLWSADPAERADINARLASTWTEEGEAYSINPATNTSILMRFRNRGGGFYLYSADPNEWADINSKLSASWVQEGPAYSTSRSYSAGAKTVWRFRNRSNGTYLYSADPTERADISARLGASWQEEGEAYYLAQ
ncbi:MAG: IPT/TIG domain-containing protein [Coriobacteriia bacterium]